MELQNDDSSSRSKYTLALSLMLILGLVVVLAVAETAALMEQIRLSDAQSREKPKFIGDCIPNFADCTKDIYDNTPCCRQHELEAGQTIPEDFVCFRFGLGICEPLSSIEELETYAHLVKFSNGTDILELLDQYSDRNDTIS